MDIVKNEANLNQVKAKETVNIIEVFRTDLVTVADENTSRSKHGIEIEDVKDFYFIFLVVDLYIANLVYFDNQTILNLQVVLSIWAFFVEGSSEVVVYPVFISPDIESIVGTTYFDGTQKVDVGMVDEPAKELALLDINGDEEDTPV